MEITSGNIDQLLIDVDTFFRVSIDTGFAVSEPSEYLIKPVSELTSSPSYDDIWEAGEHLSAAQLTNFLLCNGDKYNFWDFQLLKVQASSMCIILFLNNYPEQEELGIHCAFPDYYSSKDPMGPGDRCVFLIVKSVLDEFMKGLFKGKVTPDEFDRESRGLSSRVSKDWTLEQIAFIIADVFNKSFNLTLPADGFLEPATRIKELLQPKEVGK